MTDSYTPEYLQKHLQVPDIILPFALATPRLLPGETDNDYYRLFDYDGDGTLARHRSPMALGD